MLKKSSNDALNFIRSRDGELESLMLAACLTALGIPFSERPAFAVSGDTEPVVNWLFDESCQHSSRHAQPLHFYQPPYRQCPHGRTGEAD